MNVSIQRLTFTNLSTIGDLICGPFTAKTLELAVGNGGPGFCIFPGTYDLVIRWSPRFGRLMPHIEPVPLRAGILLHWGNDPKATEGCVLVGTSVDPTEPNFIDNSVKAFDAFWTVLTSGLTLPAGPDAELFVMKLGIVTITGGLPVQTSNREQVLDSAAGEN